MTFPRPKGSPGRSEEGRTNRSREGLLLLDQPLPFHQLLLLTLLATRQGPGNQEVPPLKEEQEGYTVRGRKNTQYYLTYPTFWYNLNNSFRASGRIRLFLSFSKSLNLNLLCNRNFSSVLRSSSPRCSCAWRCCSP